MEVVCFFPLKIFYNRFASGDQFDLTLTQQSMIIIIISAVFVIIISSIFLLLRKKWPDGHNFRFVTTSLSIFDLVVDIVRAQKSLFWNVLRLYLTDLYHQCGL